MAETSGQNSEGCQVRQRVLLPLCLNTKRVLLLHAFLQRLQCPGQRLVHAHEILPEIFARCRRCSGARTW